MRKLWPTTAILFRNIRQRIRVKWKSFIRTSSRSLNFFRFVVLGTMKPTPTIQFNKSNGKIQKTTMRKRRKFWKELAVDTSENYQKNERNVVRNPIQLRYRKHVTNVTRHSNVPHNFNCIFGRIAAKGERSIAQEWYQFLKLALITQAIRMLILLATICTETQFNDSHSYAYQWATIPMWNLLQTIRCIGKLSSSQKNPFWCSGSSVSHL